MFFFWIWPVNPPRLGCLGVDNGARKIVSEHINTIFEAFHASGHAWNKGWKLVFRNSGWQGFSKHLIMNRTTILSHKRSKLSNLLSKIRKCLEIHHQNIM